MASNQKRPRSLAAAVELAQRDTAGLDDPFAGVVSERALLYAPPGGHAVGSWGFDGTPGSAERIHVHRDGYSSAHVGGCATDPSEPEHERRIRQAGLDRDEAEYMRLVHSRPEIGALTPRERNILLARELGISLRTLQRRDASMRKKLADLKKARWEGTDGDDS